MKRKPAVVGLCAIVIGVSLLFVTYARTEIKSSQPDPQANQGHSDKANGPSEVEIVTVRPDGFEPKEMTRPPGPFYLIVDNKSGFNEIDLSLDAETGKKVHAEKLPKNRGKWKQRMVLTPGTYVLREANNPEWSCRITVQP